MYDARVGKLLSERRKVDLGDGKPKGRGGGDSGAIKLNWNELGELAVAVERRTESGAGRSDAEAY